MTDAITTPASTLTGQRLGPYEIIAPFREASGVYQGRCDADGVDVLVYTSPDEELEEGEIALFEREAEKAKHLVHPGIVPAHGWGRQRGYLFLAAELRGDETLARALEAGLPVDRGLDICRQILEALRSAHQRDILHRGLCADAVRIDADGKVTVVGFGAPRPHAPLVTRAAAGTLPELCCMAPEQITGDAVGPAADLYAVGVLTYQMLTGRLPYASESSSALIYRSLNESPVPVTSLNSAVPQQLDDLVHQLLEKEPERRHESALQALTELEEARRRYRLAALADKSDESRPRDAVEVELPSRDFRTRFVGRQADLETLVSRHVASSGQISFVRGEAGIGKTRLAQELAERVHDAGGKAVWGTCPFEQGVGSYTPFFDVLGQLLAGEVGDPFSEQRERLTRILAQQAPELATLTASPGTVAGVRAGFAETLGGEEDPTAVRLRLYEAVLQILTTAAADRPLVVVVEDAHWADDGSVELIRYLAPRLRESPVSLLVTFRPEEIADESDGESALSALLRDLDDESVVAQLPLARLSAESTHELADSLFPEVDFSDDFGRHLYAQSQGSPFVAIEMLKLLYHRGGLHRDKGFWALQSDMEGEGVPSRVRSLISRRMDELDLDDRELLQVAAVIGQRFTVAQLEAAAGMPRLALMRTLFGLEKRHHLIVGQRGAYEFAHSTIREALYDELPWELRREYHRVVGVVLGGQNGVSDHAAIGHHLYRAEQFEDAVPHLQVAAEEAGKLCDWRAVAALSDHLTEACRLTEAPDDQLVAALRQAGQAYADLTTEAEARARFIEILRVSTQAGRTTDEAEAWLLLGRLDRQVENFAAAIGACERAVDAVARAEATGERTVIQVRAQTTWGAIDFERGRYELAERRWQEALDLLGDGDSDERADVLNNLAVLATMRGELGRASELYQQVLAIDDIDSPSSKTVLTYQNMGMLQADQESWDEALALYERGLELCRQTRSIRHEPAVLLNRAEALIGKGEIDDARAAVDLARRGFRRLDDALGVADTMRLEGRLHREEGNWDEARNSLERSIEINREFGESVSLAEALHQLGLLSHRTEEHEAAREALLEAERIFALAGAKLDLEQVRQDLESLDA